MIRQRVVCRDLVEKSVVIAMSFMAKFDEECELDVVVGVCTAWVGESRGVVPARGFDAERDEVDRDEAATFSSVLFSPGCCLHAVGAKLLQPVARVG